MKETIRLKANLTITYACKKVRKKIEKQGWYMLPPNGGRGMWEPLSHSLFIDLLQWFKKKGCFWSFQKGVKKGSKRPKNTCESKGMKKGDGRIKSGCFGKPKTPNFGSVSFSFFVDPLKTSKLTLQNQWVNA